MANKNYKRLGSYIEQVNVRNTNVADYPLLGVSVQKVFIPSIANTVGTDFSKYKVIARGQFTYIADTSRRGDKIGVALLDSHDNALVSQAYTTFKVIDENLLNPSYLMMWFTRPEFDRYARYHSIGSVREVFDWDAMCDVELPIPSIEKQREIVAEFQSIENKIKINEQICEKLEEAAQALYRHWFVDFEFPNEVGLPYKSSGGEMVWNEEMDKEVPRGWEVKSLDEIATYKNGLALQKFPPKNISKSYGVIKIRELGVGMIDNNSDRCSNKIPEDTIVYNGDVIFSWSGTLKVDIWTGETAGLNQHLFKVYSEKYPKWLYYYSTKHHLDNFIRIADSNKTSLGHIKRKHLEEAKLCFPKSFQSFINTSNNLSDVVTYIINVKNQNKELVQLQNLLLGKITIEINN